jgi:hypothetical protein
MATAKSKSTTAASAKAAPAPKAAAAPAAKPAPAPKPVAIKAPTKVAAAPAVSPEQRQRMIAEAAYYLAEKRGFAHGSHDADWAEAERQIDATLKG